MLTVIDAAQIRSILTWPVVVDALRSAFAAHATIVPQRHHHAMNSATMLLMPAWSAAYVGVKVVNVFPGNQGTGVPTINGSYLLSDGTTGVPIAVLDAGELTTRRTAGASLLAASYLARPDSTRLVVAGAGRLAGELAVGYGEMFPIEQITVWNRRAEGAERLASEPHDSGHDATATTDLEAACRTADIVTCATMSSEPVVRGAWLAPGSHLDLVGGFTPTMRETDDEAVRRSLVHVDTIDGALAEAGDIIQPVQSGILAVDSIVGDLFGLTSGHTVCDRSSDDITLFKSVGHALEDLAAAVTVVESVVASVVGRPG